ncbi:HNH endonuclease [Enhygromyxa salina]|uniref:HNH endonuclease n=1 Tax=Enhygromyxa salina TaxID=215803 RepID=A0A2S9XXV0_9BACT|nr:HNH endonuclease [Enhygromyxa salina]PRP97551.1 HNH endonuclease [Enhygromyxa salina]
MAAQSDDTIAFATQLLELVHRADTTTSYKYALLIALTELAVEGHGRAGKGELTTRQLATRVLELYWPQARAFHGGEHLRQLGGRGKSIVDHIAEFRASLDGGASSPQLAARRDRSGYERLLDRLEWLLIRNPIPRLQRLGKQPLDLLYDSLSWPEEPPKRPITAYQRALADGDDELREFDNRITLHEGVGAKLATLAPLLLPLVRREWTRFVARRNLARCKEAQLEDFLFAPSREQLGKLRPGLTRLQDRRCFYCDEALTARSEVDHFLAWSRCGASAIDNLVIAHSACNGDKSDLLVARHHLDRWIDRLDRRRDDLRELAERRHWYAEPGRIGALVRASYDGLGQTTPLWVARETWIPAGAERLAPTRRALTRVLRQL